MWDRYQGREIEAIDLVLSEWQVGGSHDLKNRKMGIKVRGPEPVMAARRELSVLLSVGVWAVAFLLNHTTRLAGFNLSLADLILVVILAVLAFEHRLLIPRRIIVFTALLLGWLAFLATFIVPVAYDVLVPGAGVFADLLKVIVSFAYFIVGYSIARASAQLLLLQGFAAGAVLVSLIGLLSSVVHIPQLADIVYFGSIRFRGFMSDPNFYSILACAAIPYFVRAAGIPRPVRIVAASSLALSVVLSGSKTGLASLIMIALLLGADKILRARAGLFIAAIVGIATVVIVILYADVGTWLRDSMREHSDTLPQLLRLSELFDPDSNAYSDDGSGRDSSWANAAAVIVSSIFLGVGAGAYQIVAHSLTGSDVLAHNTYLQLTAEWGILFAGATLAFVAWILFRLVKHPRGGRGNDAVILRDMLIVFMVGSYSLSLNNARMFWLFLGVSFWLIASERQDGHILSRPLPHN